MAPSVWLMELRTSSLEPRVRIRESWETRSLDAVRPFLPFEFTDEPLTSHAGLELFRRFCGGAGWIDRLREVFADRRFDTDYGSFRTTLMVVGMLLLGGSRLSHLRVLDRDPLFLRFLRLRRLPDERTLSRSTIEFDGTVLRTGECAERRFSPHHPKDPSYYPLTAHLAQTGQLLGVWNRPGNAHDSVGAAEPLAAWLGGRKRTCRPRVLSLRTLRFTLLKLPSRIAQPAGRAVLRIAASSTSRLSRRPPALLYDESNAGSGLEQWMGRWHDLVDFEVHEVIAFEEAARRILCEP